MHVPDLPQLNSFLEALSQGDSKIHVQTGAVFACGVLLSCIGSLLRLVCRWRYFAKAGDRGWKALIPIYSTYTEFSLFWKRRMFFLLLAVSLAFPLSCAFAVRDSKLLLLAAVLSVLELLIVFRKTHKLSQAFGHGIGFTLGLIFLQPVFLLILAFGKSRYIGPAYR